MDLEREEWQPLLEKDAEIASIDDVEIGEEEAAEFPAELIHDTQESYTEEQRQTLYQKIMGMNPREKLRLAFFANREGRNILIHDPKKMIALAVLRNRKLNDTEIVQYAQKRELCEDVIWAIAKEPKWAKSYQIKLALASNPKTMVTTAINFLSHLYERDLKGLARDVSVSGVLRRKAQELLRARHKK